MRVLLLCGDPGVPVYGPSGSSAHLRDIARALALRGHEVRVAALRLADRRGAVQEPLELPTFTAPPRRWGWLPRRFRDRGELWDGRRLVRRALADGWRPDLVWERWSLFCDAGGRLGVPQILEVNAPLTLERTAIYHRPWAERVEGRVLRRASRVVAVSRWLADWASERGATDVRHVPNGSALPPGDRARGRAAHGLSGLVVGFVGSMKPWHGVERLPALLDAIPEATGLLVGEGPVQIAHPRLRQAGDLRGQALADALAACDVGLVPYPAGAPPWFCPLKVLDYRAVGLAVVASDLGETRQLVGDGGEVLPPDASPEAWAQAIRRQAARRPAPWRRPWTAVVDEALEGL